MLLVTRLVCASNVHRGRVSIGCRAYGCMEISLQPFAAVEPSQPREEPFNCFLISIDCMQSPTSDYRVHARHDTFIVVQTFFSHPVAARFPASMERRDQLDRAVELSSISVPSVDNDRRALANSAERFRTGCKSYSTFPGVNGSRNEATRETRRRKGLTRRSLLRYDRQMEIVGNGPYSRATREATRRSRETSCSSGVSSPAVLRGCDRRRLERPMVSRESAALFSRVRSRGRKESDGVRATGNVSHTGQGMAAKPRATGRVYRYEESKSRQCVSGTHVPFGRLERERKRKRRGEGGRAVACEPPFFRFFPQAYRSKQLQRPKRSRRLLPLLSNFHRHRCARTFNEEPSVSLTEISALPSLSRGSDRSTMGNRSSIRCPRSTRNPWRHTRVRRAKLSVRRGRRFLHGFLGLAFA